MRNFIVVIPALNPTIELITYVEELLKENIPQVIVINDGSKVECDSIFTQIRDKQRCVVLEHEINRGKGQALKTAFQYILKERTKLGVVTADCDGQHSVQDVIKVGEALKDFQTGIVLGVRNFKGENIPLRSYLGNTITISIYNLLFGYKVKDTQTGLRGIPYELLRSITYLQGDRYEYEMNVLIYAARNKLTIKEVEIHTLYFDKNANSYYHPIKDSLRILKSIFRFRPNQYGFLFRFCRFIVRLVYPRYKTDAKIPTKPVVYVSHHQNLFGPFIMLLWYSKFFCTWVLNVFFEQKECYNQYVNYTFTKRFKMKPFFAKIIAYPVSFFITKLIQSGRSIPVYRGSRKIMDSIKQSVEALKEGKSIAIFPSVDYSSAVNDESDIYEGFLFLEKYYFKETKEHVTFIPVHVSKNKRQIIHGEPIQFSGNRPFQEERTEIANKIKDQINTLAKQCGDI